MILLLAFIIPWLFAFFLLIQDKRTLLLFGPAAATIAFILNDIGLFMEWWSLQPEGKELIISLLSNLGLFLVLGCYMIHFIQKMNIKHHMTMIILFAILLASLEYIYFLLGMIHFYKGWNIGWSLVSYMVSNFMLYGYFVVIKRFID